MDDFIAFDKHLLESLGAGLSPEELQLQHKAEQDAEYKARTQITYVCPQKGCSCQRLFGQGLVYIFLFLDCYSLCSIEGVCKYWHIVMKKRENAIWRVLLCRVNPGLYERQAAQLQRKKLENYEAYLRGVRWRQLYFVADFTHAQEWSKPPKRPKPTAKTRGKKDNTQNALFLDAEAAAYRPPQLLVDMDALARDLNSSAFDSYSQFLAADKTPFPGEASAGLDRLCALVMANPDTMYHCCAKSRSFLSMIVTMAPEEQIVNLMSTRGMRARYYRLRTSTSGLFGVMRIAIARRSLPLLRLFCELDAACGIDRELIYDVTSGGRRQNTRNAFDYIEEARLVASLPWIDGLKFLVEHTQTRVSELLLSDESLTEPPDNAPYARRYGWWMLEHGLMLQVAATGSRGVDMLELVCRNFPRESTLHESRLQCLQRYLGSSSRTEKLKCISIVLTVPHALVIPPCNFGIESPLYACLGIWDALTFPIFRYVEQEMKRQYFLRHNEEMPEDEWAKCLGSRSRFNTALSLFVSRVNLKFETFMDTYPAALPALSHDVELSEHELRLHSEEEKKEDQSEVAVGEPLELSQDMRAKKIRWTAELNFLLSTLTKHCAMSAQVIQSALHQLNSDNFEEWDFLVERLPIRWDFVDPTTGNTVLHVFAENNFWDVSAGFLTRIAKFRGCVNTVNAAGTAPLAEVSVSFPVLRVLILLGADLDNVGDGRDVWTSFAAYKQRFGPWGAPRVTSIELPLRELLEACMTRRDFLVALIGTFDGDEKAARQAIALKLIESLPGLGEAAPKAPSRD